jgi:hypothetical protein
MKLFFRAHGFQDCLKIQSDLKKLAEWCKANAFELNVGGRCKSITFLRLHHPVEFPHMLESVILDRFDSVGGHIYGWQNVFF